MSAHINNDSSKLVFSIPVHEKQDIINNQIENILNFNPNAKIVIHVNKSFKNFNVSLINYPNVYINKERFNYKFGKGLLWIHINNFLEALRLNLDFSYFCVISSNEMFIRNGLIHYIEKHKNGLQLVKFDKNINWHNFNKNIENEPIIIELLKHLNLDAIYGGQAEGNFYQKDVFKKIAEIYITFFGNREINNYETEEIVCQTIFKSFEISCTTPFTLQNYSNDITYDENFINSVINNGIIIPEKTKNNVLFSPHINKDCTSIYSIKRVDRTFNNLRNYLSKKGFIINVEKYDLNTYYYSNGSKILFYSSNHLLFEKQSSQSGNHFNWFGYQLDEGYYNLNFHFKTYYPLNTSHNKNNQQNKSGLKVHNENELLYDFFLKDAIPDQWNNVRIPLHLTKPQLLIFIFDDYLDDLKIEFKNINFLKYETIEKENIAILLYENENEKNKDNDYSINYNNIYKMILEPFYKLYNIYTFLSIQNENKSNQLVNFYKPNHIDILKNKELNKRNKNEKEKKKDREKEKNNDKNKNKDKNDEENDKEKREIMKDNEYNKKTIFPNSIFYNNNQNIQNFSKINDISFKFVIYITLDSIFKKNIVDFNFFVNKFNFISYHIPYLNNKISNSFDFMSVPFKYLNDFQNLLLNNIDNKDICYSIYANLKESIGKNNFNFIYDDNYAKNIRTPLIKYLSDAKNINTNNNGYLFNKKYLYQIYYTNAHSRVLKNNNDEFYFNKSATTTHTPYQWIGLYIDYFNENKETTCDIRIEFSIKLLRNIDGATNGNKNQSNNYGLKIHEPLVYFNDWIKDCYLNNYKKIEIVTKINKKYQYIILNFDDYLDEVEFYIKDFKIFFL